MYKALLLNTKDEVEDYRICNTYETAVKQCIDWQLQHEYDFWETKIVKADNVTTITYKDKINRSHEHKLTFSIYETD